MTALAEKIRRIISLAGPMNVADYMALCLFDPEHGYYTTRQPFGRDGDFTTAPEISQMFGELVAVWLYGTWKACGAPEEAVFAEIGPGRGTLMRDMQRTIARLDRQFAPRFAMVEASPRLTAVQKEALAGAPYRPDWYERLDELPRTPLFIVGNELFDAVPVRQYVKTSAGWRERVVGIGAEAELRLMAGAGAPAPALLPLEAENTPDGTVFEHAPAREAMMDMIAERIAREGGAGLFIDYGYEGPAFGDTLQAVRRHSFDDVLAHPGEADLTAHVDFTALAAVAETHGLSAHLMPQGDFLLKMRLLERAGRLGAGKSAKEQERIRNEVERLAGPEAMGTLFKVLAVLPAGMTVPPFG